MRLIIAGSRKLELSTTFIQELVLHFSITPVTEIVSGAARGVDASGERFARVFKLDLSKFPANWDDLTVPGAIIRQDKNGRKYNSKAGVTRNTLMAEYADALLLIWDGESSGSRDMRAKMLAKNKPIYEVQLGYHF